MEAQRLFGLPHVGALGAGNRWRGAKLHLARAGPNIGNLRDWDDQDADFGQAGADHDRVDMPLSARARAAHIDQHADPPPR